MNKTLQYYNEQAVNFAAGTQNTDMSEQYASFLNKMDPGGLILDLGCGSGRDSRYFLEHGYQVFAVDGSEKLCQIAEAFIGQKVYTFTFEQIPWNNKFDGVWACASLLHCKDDELSGIMHHVVKSLKQGGIFYMSFKYGNFCGWRNGRYFIDLNEERLSVLLSQIPEVTLLQSFLTNDVRPERQHEQWFNILLQK